MYMIATGISKNRFNNLSNSIQEWDRPIVFRDYIIILLYTSK